MQARRWRWAGGPAKRFSVPWCRLVPRGVTGAGLTWPRREPPGREPPRHPPALPNPSGHPASSPAAARPAGAGGFKVPPSRCPRRPRYLRVAAPSRRLCLGFFEKIIPRFPHLFAHSPVIHPLPYARSLQSQGNARRCFAVWWWWCFGLFVVFFLPHISFFCAFFAACWQLFQLVPGSVRPAVAVRAPERQEHPAHGGGRRGGSPGAPRRAGAGATSPALQPSRRCLHILSSCLCGSYCIPFRKPPAAPSIPFSEFFVRVLNYTQLFLSSL